MLASVRSHGLIVLLVILNYALLTYTSYSDEKFSKNPVVSYQYLTEAFLHGSTSYSVLPPKALLALPNPYSYKQNKVVRNNPDTYQFKFFDVSLYKGKFYSYFGPLPVVAFFLPFKLMTGYYAPTYLSVFFFLCVGFLLSYRLMAMIRKEYFPQVPETHLMLAGLLLGFASNAPFILARPAMYEAAIASAFCFMMLSFYFLYHALKSHDKLIYITLFSFCLALTVAGRPHFAIACVAVTPLYLYYLFKHAAHERIVAKVLAYLLPVSAVAIALAGYNYARFGSILEFGVSYQLGCIPDNISHSFLNMQHMGYRILLHVYDYFLRPFPLSWMPPWVMFHYPYGPRIFSNLHIYENTAGMLITTPILFYLFFSLRRACHGVNSLNQFMLMAGCMTAAIVLFLLMSSFITQRYETDMQPYLLILAILSFWLMKNSIQAKFLRIHNTIFFVLGFVSIFIGMCLGFSLQRDLLFYIDFTFNCYGVHFFWILLNFWCIYAIFKLERKRISYLIVHESKAVAA